MSADILAFQFQPGAIEVRAGTTVTWTNQDDVEHSVTGGTPPDASGIFDSGLFAKGQSFSHTFTQPGAYPYFCLLHPSMLGVVNVTP